MKRLSLLILLFLLVTTNSYTWADSQPQVIASATSDWLYHGLSESAGEPTIGVNGELQLNSVLFLGAEFHESNVERVRQRHRSVSTYIGTGFNLTNDWYSTVFAKYRFFPGSLREWDYAEFGVQLSHTNGWSLNVDFAPDYYDLDSSAVAAQLGYSSAIKQNWYWRGHVGGLAFANSRFNDHHFAALGIGYSINAITIDVAYHWNSRDGSPTFAAPIESPGLVASLSYQWF